MAAAGAPWRLGLRGARRAPASARALRRGRDHRRAWRFGFPTGRRRPSFGWCEARAPRRVASDSARRAACATVWRSSSLPSSRALAARAGPTARSCPSATEMAPPARTRRRRSRRGPRAAAGVGKAREPVSDPGLGTGGRVVLSSHGVPSSLDSEGPGAPRCQGWRWSRHPPRRRARRSLPTGRVSRRNAGPGGGPTLARPRSRPRRARARA